MSLEGRVSVVTGGATGLGLQMATGLAEACKLMGVTFRYGTTVEGIDVMGDRASAVRTDKGQVTGDVYVLSLGSYSPLVAKNLDINLPVYPVKGYSLTLPIEDRNGALDNLRECFEALGMGEQWNDSGLMDLGAGGYATMPAEMRHFFLARTAATFQVHGMGPFAITYVNPADDPSKQSR